MQLWNFHNKYVYPYIWWSSLLGWNGVHWCPYLFFGSTIVYSLHSMGQMSWSFLLHTRRYPLISWRTQLFHMFRWSFCWLIYLNWNLNTRRVICACLLVAKTWSKTISLIIGFIECVLYIFSEIFSLGILFS